MRALQGVQKFSIDTFRRLITSLVVVTTMIFFEGVHTFSDGPHDIYHVQSKDGTYEKLRRCSCRTVQTLACQTCCSWFGLAGSCGVWVIRETLPGRPLAKGFVWKFNVCGEPRML